MIQRDLLTPLKFVLLIVTYKIDQSIIKKATSLYLIFGLDMDHVPLKGQKIASNNIPGIEKVTSLRPRLINLLRNQLPKALIIQAFGLGLFEIEMVSV